MPPASLQHTHASMGPRSHERGNGMASLRNAPALALQWGRVLMNAETPIAEHQRAGMVALQWGRVLMNAETAATKPIDFSKVALQWGRVLMNAETGEQPTIRASSR